MPRGQRQSRNPVEKLFEQAGQIENTLQALLESAGKPDFINSIESLRKKREEDQSKKSKLNADSREVLKLLQTYPGLSKTILVSLKSKISEYKNLGILDKYKTDPEPQEKPKVGAKQKTAEVSE